MSQASLSSPNPWLSKLLKWWHHDWIQVVSVFVVINVLRMWPALWQAKTIYFGDNYSLLVPGRLFSVQWLKQGILPLWNPYIFSGISWIGDITHSIFYPTTLFFWLFHPAVALNVTVVAHLLLTMVGMYLLARWFSKNHSASLVVSVLWMVSSQVTGSLNNLQTLQSLAWLPWVMYASLFVHRSIKGGVFFALVILANLSAGYPQHVLSVLPVAAIFSLFVLSQEQPLSWRRLLGWVGRWLLTGLISLGLSAFLLWPFVETLLSSTRLVQSADQAARGSLHPLELIKLWVPYFFDAPALGLRWGPSWNTFPTAVPYFTPFGWLALVLTTKLKKLDAWQKFFLMWMAVTLVISLGSNLPGYTWMLDHIPFSTTMRYPSSWLVMTNICGLLLLAYNWSSLTISRHWQRWLLPLSLVGAALAAGAWVILRTNFGWVWQVLNAVTGQALANSIFHTPDRDQMILSLIAANVAVLLSIFGLTLWAWGQKRIWLVMLLIMAEAALSSQLIWVWGPNHIYDLPQATSLMETVRDPQHRLMTRNFNRPYTDFGSYWEALAVRAPFSDSFIDAQELAEPKHLERLRDGLTPDWNYVVSLPVANGYTTLVPLDYQMMWEGTGEARINALSYIPLDHRLLRQWAVKYYIVDEWFKIDEDFSAFPKIYDHYPWSVYELPTLSRFRLDNDEAIEIAELTETPNTIHLRFTNLPGHGYLKIADRYERGWIATVNDQEVRVENWGGLRAVPIAQGENRVVLEYRPMSFYLGVIITAGTTLGLASGWLLTWLKRRRTAR